MTPIQPIKIVMNYYYKKGVNKIYKSILKIKYGSK